jgi:hypothetical protein
VAKQAKAPHRIDHRGDYIILPGPALNQIMAANYPRALAVLLAIQSEFNGWNNGSITVSMRQIGKAIGSPDNVANAMAVSWLEQAGFIWIGKTHSKGSRKAREYGLTYANSYDGPAQHTYLQVAAPQPEVHRQDWKQAQERGWKDHTRKPSSVLDTNTERKQSVSKSYTDATEKSHSCPPSPVLDSYTPILCHPSERVIVPFPSSESTQYAAGHFRGAAAMGIEELRSFALRYIDWAGVGSQSRLAADAGVPGGSLSKFLAGKSLASAHRLPLQLAIGKAWPVEARGAA